MVDVTRPIMKIYMIGASKRETHGWFVDKHQETIRFFLYSRNEERQKRELSDSFSPLKTLLFVAVPSIIDKRTIDFTILPNISNFKFERKLPKLPNSNLVQIYLKQHGSLQRASS